MYTVQKKNQGLDWKAGKGGWNWKASIIEYLSIKIKMLSLNSLTLGGPETREEA